MTTIYNYGIVWLGEVMKLQILLEITFMLLSKEKVTLREIMNRFEISKRTAIRYIDTLCIANVPVSVTHGRNGGYFIPKEYKLRGGFFTADDLEILNRILSEHLNDEDGDKIKALKEKLDAFSR